MTTTSSNWHISWLTTNPHINIYYVNYTNICYSILTTLTDNYVFKAHNQSTMRDLLPCWIVTDAISSTQLHAQTLNFPEVIAPKLGIFFQLQCFLLVFNEICIVHIPFHEHLILNVTVRYACSRSSKSSHDVSSWGSPCRWIRTCWIRLESGLSVLW